MPLTGLRCCRGGEGSFDSCIANAAYGGPGACRFPAPLLRQMSTHEEHRKGAGRSATGLLACPRQHILLREHEYTEDPDSYYPLFEGEAIHTIMEKHGDFDGWVTERRYARDIEIDGITYTVTGKPDAFHPVLGMIRDYKTTRTLIDCTKKKYASEWCLERAKEEHVDQLNIYSWILYDGYDVESGEAVRHDIDFGEIYYLNRGVKSFQVPIWHPEVQDAFVRDRLAPLVTHDLTGELPPVLPDQVKVSVSKKTGKETVRTSRHWRCGYCPVRQLCDQLAEEGK